MPARTRRRAVGPPGAQPSDGDWKAKPTRPEDADTERDRADEERLRRERPPHHDQDR
ncbi:MAG: hypothetical protein ABIO67_05505 [Mycobacteriales bacterium]